MDGLRQGLSIAVVFALLGTAIWALRRGTAPLRGVFSKRATTSPRPLELIDRVVLTPQHCLHVVRTGGRELVLATHPHGCSVIAEDKAGGMAA
jgi:flagellar biogenesis protein FliO